MSIRVTFVALTFLSVVAGYFLLADFRTSATEIAAPWFYNVNMDDIVRIQFTTRDGDVAFYQEKPKPKPDSAVAEQPPSVWRFDDKFAMPVDSVRWGGVTLLLSGPQSRRALARKFTEPERFGLDRPGFSVDVQLTGDRSVRLHLGDRTPDSLNYYIIQEGNPGLYLIDGIWGDVLAKLTKEQPFPPWYYKIGPDKAFFLQVKHEGRENAYRLERFVGEPDQWRLSGKDGPLVDDVWWKENMAPILGGPKVLRVLQRGVDDPAKYGLDSPMTSVHVEYRPPFEPDPEDPAPELSRQLDLLVGAMLPDGTGYYAQPKGQDYLFLVDKDWREVMATLATAPPIVSQPTQPPSGS